MIRVGFLELEAKIDAKWLALDEGMMNSSQSCVSEAGRKNGKIFVFFP